MHEGHVRIDDLRFLAQCPRSLRILRVARGDHQHGGITPTATDLDHLRLQCRACELRFADGQVHVGGVQLVGRVAVIQRLQLLPGTSTITTLHVQYPGIVEIFLRAFRVFYQFHARKRLADDGRVAMYFVDARLDQPETGADALGGSDALPRHQ